MGTLGRGNVTSRIQAQVRTAEKKGPCWLWNVLLHHNFCEPGEGKTPEWESEIGGNSYSKPSRAKHKPQCQHGSHAAAAAVPRSGAAPPLSPLLLLTYQLAAFVPRLTRADGEQPKSGGKFRDEAARRRGQPDAGSGHGGGGGSMCVRVRGRDELAQDVQDTVVSREKMSQGCAGNNFSTF